jgi:hypothetical protein
MLSTMPRTTGGWIGRVASWALAAALLAIALLVGPSAGPAAACSCMAVTDAEAFDMATAVFVGEVIDYQPPPPSDTMSSTDEAVWTFGVSEVFKGEVTTVQPVVSAVFGASCGLEIERQGEYLVFASDASNSEFRYNTGLCTGTRSTSAGAPDLAVASTPPLPPAANADPLSPPGTDTGTSGTSAGTSLVGWAVGGTAVVAAAAVGLRAFRSRRLADPIDRR